MSFENEKRVSSAHGEPVVRCGIYACAVCPITAWDWFPGKPTPFDHPPQGHKVLSDFGLLARMSGLAESDLRVYLGGMGVSATGALQALVDLRRMKPLTGDEFNAIMRDIEGP